jgi:two-component system cell cycle sensor histidine kinase/response regulator CckA
VTPQKPAGVTLALDRGPGLWPVRADPAQLAQVLTNLCLNALEAMSGTGTLAMRASNDTLTAEQIGQDLEARPGEFVRFVVEDSGAGIPAEVLDKIFDPFFTTKPVGRGSGLGLAMVYGIVKQHHGWVSCHSEAGRGTRFELYLPRAEPDAGEPAASRLVLLADDNDVLRALAAAYLRQGGYEVLQAADGREAVELFEREQGRVDLVILARALTHQPGAEALRRMRSVKPSVRGLLAGDAQAGEASDEAGVVARPYREGDLLEAVRRALL